MAGGWIGVDLDATLAEYHGWNPEIGKPIPKMLKRVKQWLADGKDVRIFTARVWPLGTFDENKTENKNRVIDAKLAKDKIQRWCLLHFGRLLPITCTKDFSMIELWDDRAVQVVPNTGMTIEESLRQRIKTSSKIAASAVRMNKTRTNAIAGENNRRGLR